MPTFDQMKDTIYDVINGLTLVAVDSIEYQFQNSPHPDKPYFALLLTSFLKIGRDGFTDPDESGVSSMIGNRDFTLQILGFGSGIVEKTTQLQTSFERPDIHELFRDGGIFPYNIDQPVQDISGLDDSENEERSSWDVMMRTDSVITGVPVGLILKVNGEGTYKQLGKPDITRDLSIDSTT